MPSAPKFPQIPMPDATNESMQRALSAVISTLSMLTGTDPKSQSGTQANANSVHTFVQDTMPTALNPGDFWLTQSPKVTLSCWTGDRWSHLLDAP